VYKQPENPSWIARKHNIGYSAYKLMSVANLITGKHLYEALNVLNETDKKGGPIVRSVLEACRKNGENKGFAEDRMFVKTAIVGKALDHKKIDIKGRGR
jgi:ribosomal protein L22